MKVKKEICLKCNGKGHIGPGGNYCEDCKGKGYTEIKPDKNGIFPFSVKRCICPSCGEGKSGYYPEYRGIRRYTRETYQTISDNEEIIIDNYTDVCCARCGYKWLEYFDDLENI